MPIDPHLSVPGTPVHVRFTKWHGGAHWEYDGVLLGHDAHGDWVGFPIGTAYARPGAAFDSSWPTVALFPDAGWTPAFNRGHPGGTLVYIDLATTPEWRREGDRIEVTMVDLDLDVVVKEAAAPFIDDEDEFAEHLVAYAYPDELVARVRTDADALLAAVEARRPPFDGPTADRWLDRLAALG